MDKLKTCLGWGLLGAFIGVAGELLVGLSPSTDLRSPMAALFSSLEALPYWRLGLCATVGSIGILLQFLGCRGIWLSFEDRENPAGRLYLTSAVGYTVIGAICHILCCVFLYLWQITLEGPGQLILLKDFLLWFCLPFVILFFVSYLLLCLLFSLQIGLGHSRFPRWCALLNPLLLNMGIQAGAYFLPASALANGIRFASMGLASILLFFILLTVSWKK